MSADFEAFGKPADAPAVTVTSPPPAASTPALNAALAKAQSKFTPPAKTKTVDFLDKNGRRVYYKYADLADVIEVIRGPLSENGLGFASRLGYNERGSYGMRTELRHDSGEAVDTWYPLPDPAKTQINPKEFGSAMTYGRRYSLEALVGVASQEDDDADSAPPSDPPSQPKTKAPSSPAPKAGPKVQGPPSEAQLKRLFTVATTGEGAWTKEQLKEYMGIRWKITSTKELTRAQYDALVDVSEKKTYQQACASMISEPKV